MTRQRSSLRISLLLAGAAGLAGCGPDPRTEYRRDVYATIEDCKADWQRDESCERSQRPGPNNVGSSGAYYYYGPRYTWNRDWDPGPRPGGETATRPLGSRALSSISVERGGFGLFSRFHSSGG